jgi:hypothetical protein
MDFERVAVNDGSLPGVFVRPRLHVKPEYERENT